MTIRTVEEIQADIAALNAAKMQLLTGKRFTSLEIGSDAMRRRYTYGEASLQDLEAALRQLYDELAIASGAVPASPFMDTTQFRASSMPLVYNKGTH